MLGIFFLSASQILIHVIFITTLRGNVADTIAPLMIPWSIPATPIITVDSSMWTGSEDYLLMVNILVSPSYTIPPLLLRMTHSLMPLHELLFFTI